MSIFYRLGILGATWYYYKISEMTTRQKIDRCSHQFFAVSSSKVYMIMTQKGLSMTKRQKIDMTFCCKLLQKKNFIYPNELNEIIVQVNEHLYAKIK